MSVLFTDLVDSTATFLSLPARESERVRRRYFDLLRDAVATHDGTVVKSTGDGVMAVFRSASSAVEAAMGLQSAAGRHFGAEPVPLQTRAGVSIGEIVEDEGDWYGGPVVEAARLCAAATGNQILASELVRRIAGDVAKYVEVGELALKGLPDPVQAHEVLWQDARAAAPLPSALGATDDTPFVGRHVELARLVDALKEASTGGTALAFVSGEPGIGKTRLLREFARRAHADRAVVLYGRCDEHGGPYLPVAEALSRWARDIDPSAMGRLEAAHRRVLASLVPELATDNQDLGDSADRVRIFRAVAELFGIVRADGPVVFIVDDLHWADTESLALLRHLVQEHLRESLIIGTYRDTEIGPVLGPFLGDVRRLMEPTRVELRGLSQPAVAELLGGDAAEDVARRVHDHTNGNPLFVRELWLHLLESGATSFDELAVPEGVRDAIAGRLDRLSDDARYALVRAAVLGLDADVAVLERMCNLEGDRLLAALEESASARLVSEHGTARPAYSFTHVLVRRTIYDELSIARRQRLHLDAAEAIEAAHPAANATVRDAIATHFRAAGTAAPLERVTAALVAAATGAERGAAFGRAADLWRAAATLQEERAADPITRAGFLERLGDVAYMSGDDRAGGLVALEQALTIYERSGRLDRAARVRSRLGRHLSTVSPDAPLDVPAAIRHFEAALPVLEASSSAVALCLTKVGYANALLRAVRVRDALKETASALELAEAIGHEAIWPSAALLRGWALWEAGDLGPGGALVQRAWEEAHRLENGLFVFLTTWQLGNQALQVFDNAQAIHCYERELDSALLRDAPGNRSLLQQTRVHAYLTAGRLDEGRAAWRQMGEPLTIEDWATDSARVEESLDALRSQGDLWAMTWNVGRWISHLARFDLRASLALLDECLDLAKRGGAVVIGAHASAWQVVVAAWSDDRDVLERAGAAVARHFPSDRETWRGLGAFGDLAQAIATSDREMFEGAIDVLTTTYPRPVEVTEGLLAWARVTGDASAGERAAAIYERVGLGPAWTERARTVLG